LKKIFILDDDADIIDVIHHILRDTYVVRSKTDANNIIRDIEEFTPDLLMIDNFIGEQNATEIINLIRQGNPSFNIPVVLFSASYDLATTARAIGATSHLEKPASIKKIRAHIQQVFENA
jgi:CheY-like chemotaxis protein